MGQATFFMLPCSTINSIEIDRNFKSHFLISKIASTDEIAVYYHHQNG